MGYRLRLGVSHPLRNRQSPTCSRRGFRPCQLCALEGTRPAYRANGRCGRVIQHCISRHGTSLVIIALQSPVEHSALMKAIMGYKSTSAPLAIPTKVSIRPTMLMAVWNIRVLDTGAPSSAAVSGAGPSVVFSSAGFAAASSFASTLGSGQPSGVSSSFSPAAASSFASTQGAAEPSGVFSSASVA